MGKMGIISSTNKTKSKYYEPSVDGLRALAVIIVILFHAGFDWIPGGFVGVDVFFVISGYLITGIIFASNQKKIFSYKAFILSRVSRLYPALISTLIFTIIFSFIILNPQDLINTGKTLAYTIFSASNFFFMNGSGYFDSSSESNPLLHTWSLAVEQQFYLVWPLIILLASRFGRRGAFLSIATVGVISLFLSQLSINSHATANYFMPWFRAFEFSFGGMVFFIPKPNKDKLTNSILFTTGIGLILYSAFFFSKSTAFPGVNAMIPVIGSCLAIRYGDQSRAGCILSNGFMVGIGVISYSVYLIHWPLMVFYKYYFFRPISTIEMVVLSVAPFVLAIPNYNFVENKYRRLNLSSVNSLSASFLVASVAVLSISYFFISYNGMPFRTNSYFKEKMAHSKDFHLQQYGGSGYKEMGVYELGDKTQDKYSAILIGDSFARQYAYAIDNNPHEMRIITSVKDGCYFSLRMTEFNGGARDDDCPTRLRTALDISKDKNLPVIFSLRWYGYKNMIGPQGGSPKKFNSDEEYISELLNNVKDIVAAFNGVKMVIIGSTPGVEGVGGVESCVTRPDYLPLVCAQNLVTTEKDNLNRSLNVRIKDALKDDHRVLFIDPYEYMCVNGKCTTMTNDFKFLYSDSTHLSKDGAQALWSIIGIKIKEFVS